MPELPEVESVVRSLRGKVENKLITDLTITPKGEKIFSSIGLENAKSAIKNSQIKSLDRIGKYILINFQDIDGGGPQKNGSDFVGVSHLRMTGKYLLEEQGSVQISPSYLVNSDSLDTKEGLDPHIRFSLLFEDGSKLHFSDMRRFATFEIHENISQNSGIVKLGVDPTKTDLTSEYLVEKLKSKTKNIYNALLDQSIVAGLGNIYVCEVLARASISPISESRAVAASKELIDELIIQIDQVLESAIEAQGTTFKDFQKADSSRGGFQEKLLVYGQTRAVVDGVEYQVEKIKISGRYAHYIPEIQKLIKI